MLTKYSNKLLLNLLVISGITLGGCTATVEKEVATTPRIDKALQQQLTDAVSAIKSKNNRSAKITLKRIIKQHPQLSIAHINLGIIQLAEKNDAEALKTFNNVISFEPGNAIALNHIGIIYRKNGQFEQAKNAYENAIKHDPDYAYAYLNLGILNDLYLNKLDAALVNYKKYHELTNQNDKQVANWLVEVERRYAKQTSNK